MTKKVLGVKIDDVSMDLAMVLAKKWLAKKSTAGRIIVTPGPEFLVTAQKDSNFKKILNNADLSVPDGFGLHLAGISNRVTGVDLMIALCDQAQRNGWTIGMIGNPNTLRASEKLQELFPELKILYALDNPQADKVMRSFDTLEYVDILFVGVGHPKQEKFLWSCHANHKFRVGMGVGGSFDFISGRVWEPGLIFQKLGLKWLGRLLSNPGHSGRVVKATVIFPLLLLKDKLL